MAYRQCRRYTGHALGTLHFGYVYYGLGWHYLCPSVSGGCQVTRIQHRKYCCVARRASSKNSRVPDNFNYRTREIWCRGAASRSEWCWHGQMTAVGEQPQRQKNSGKKPIINRLFSVSAEWNISELIVSRSIYHFWSTPKRPATQQSQLIA